MDMAARSLTGQGKPQLQRLRFRLLKAHTEPPVFAHHSDDRIREGWQREAHVVIHGASEASGAVANVSGQACLRCRK